MASLPSLSSLSPSRSLRTTCSGVWRCRFIVVSPFGPRSWAVRLHNWWTTIRGPGQLNTERRQTKPTRLLLAQLALLPKTRHTPEQIILTRMLERPAGSAGEGEDITVAAVISGVRRGGRADPYVVDPLTIVDPISSSE